MSTRTTTVVTVAFVVLLLSSAALMLAISRTRIEILTVLSPAGSLAAGIHDQAARCLSYMVEYQLTENPADQGEYLASQERIDASMANIRALLGSFPGDKQLSYERLEDSLEIWRKHMLLGMKAPYSRIETERLYEALRSLANVHRASTDLYETINDEIGGRRQRLDRFERANTAAVLLIAFLGVFLTIRTARASRQLTAALKERNEILRVVSHDLRNPLTPIRLAAMLLLKESATEAKRQEYASMIHRSAETMDKMIGDLLEAARTENGTALDLERKPLDIGNLMVQTCETWRHVAEQKQISISIDASETCVVNVDEQRISQVISNLLANAIKFTPAGGGIRLRCRRLETDVEVSISDNGPGIPDLELEHIFEPFWHKTRSGASGTGLGLWIVKRIVEEHGGRIIVSSSGPGTTFTFTVPVR